MKKFFILFIVVPILAIKDAAKTQEELMARIEANNKECSKTSNVDPQVLSRAQQGDVDTTNANLIKHVLCYMKIADLADDNDLIRSVAQAKFEAQFKGGFDVQKGLDACDAEVKKEGDYALYITKKLACIYKTFPKGIRVL